MFGLIVTISIICCIGIPLNGIAIWLLGFKIKRNPFTILIINLAIADFGYLVFVVIPCIDHFIVFVPTEITYLIIVCLTNIMYLNGIFLVAAISIDQCVCVFFPIWDNCSRPKHWSPAVCAFLWICSVLLVGIPKIVEYKFEYNISQGLHLFVISMIFLLLITISTVILFVKMCLKPKQIKHRRLLVMILITLLFFLILTLPFHIYLFIIRFSDLISWRQFLPLKNYFILGACLNSSVNPVIYYLFGRKKQAQTRESIKVIFQRVFREDEDPESTEESANRVSTSL